MTTRSAIFQAYNAAKPMVRAGQIDGKRLNRALGVAQSQKVRPYVTTVSFCSCPDFLYNSKRSVPCKHMYALLLLRAAR